MREWDTERNDLKNRIIEYEKKIESVKSQKKQLYKTKDEDVEIVLGLVMNFSTSIY